MTVLSFATSVLLVLIFFTTSNGDVQLQCNSPQCLTEPVQYQCNETGSSVLRWRILNASNATLDENSFNVGDGLPNTNQLLDNPMFSITLTATDSNVPSLSSFVSFTVMQSMNGFIIECENLLGNIKKECPIAIADIPAPPTNIIIDANSSVDISWTESSSPCVTGYRYNVLSTAPGWVNITMESNSNSVTVEGLVPSDEQYSVIVNAIDTANRNSSENRTSFLFQVPNAVGNVNASDETVSNETNVTISWEKSINFGIDTIVFDVENYRVTLFNITELDVMPAMNDSGLLPPDTTSYTFSPVSPGRIYSVSVFAINGVGSSVANTTIDVDGDIIYITALPTTTMATVMTSTSISNGASITSSTTMSTFFMSSTSVSTTSSSPSGSPTVVVSDPAGLGTGAIIGIAVAGVIIAILVVIVVILLIVYCCCLKGSHESDEPMPLKATKHPVSATHTHALPETGQATYQDPASIERKQAPTGDLYAQPDASSKRRPPPQPELATYQDPNTIQRTQAHTGDFYAQPEKKKPAQGGSQVYADLDMHSSVSPRSPQLLIQPESQPSVIYSGVHHQ